jgi:hypothetical protein
MNCPVCKEVEVGQEGELCGRCHWSLRTQFEAGLSRLRVYLQRWAEFREWELANSLEPTP